MILVAGSVRWVKETGPGRSSEGAFNPDATWHHFSRTSEGAITPGATTYHHCRTSEGG